MDEFRVGNLQCQDEEEPVHAAEARRDVKLAPGGRSISVLIEKGVNNRGPIDGVIL